MKVFIYHVRRRYLILNDISILIKQSVSLCLFMQKRHCKVWDVLYFALVWSSKSFLSSLFLYLASTRLFCQAPQRNNAMHLNDWRRSLWCETIEMCRCLYSYCRGSVCGLCECAEFIFDLSARLLLLTFTLTEIVTLQKQPMLPFVSLILAVLLHFRYWSTGFILILKCLWYSKVSSYFFMLK